MLQSTILKTPLGRMRLVASPSGLRSALFCEQGDDALPRITLESDASEPLRVAVVALQSYFERAPILPPPLDLEGSAFQRRVWDALLEIQHGQTRSYAEIAERLGSVARAIGSANAQNPVAILVPCHRVIGADGSLTGYAGGLERKRWLLEHEGALRQRALGF